MVRDGENARAESIVLGLLSKENLDVNVKLPKIRLSGEKLLGIFFGHLKLQKKIFFDRNLTKLYLS